MEITVKGTKYKSGKINRKKYKTYTEAKKKIAEKEEKNIEYNEEDFDLMVNTLVELYDGQFTEDDINEDFEVADIIFEFMHCDIEVMGKLDNKLDKAIKVFTKGKK